MFKVIKLQRIFLNLFHILIGITCDVFYEFKDKICNNIISLFKRIFNLNKIDIFYLFLQVS